MIQYDVEALIVLRAELSWSKFQLQLCGSEKKPPSLCWYGLLASKVFDVSETEIGSENGHWLDGKGYQPMAGVPSSRHYPNLCANYANCLYWANWIIIQHNSTWSSLSTCLSSQCDTHSYIWISGWTKCGCSENWIELVFFKLSGPRFLITLVLGSDDCANDHCEPGSLLQIFKGGQPHFTGTVNETKKILEVLKGQNDFGQNVSWKWLQFLGTGATGLYPYNVMTCPGPNLRRFKGLSTTLDNLLQVNRRWAPREWPRHSMTKSRTNFWGSITNWTLNARQTPVPRHLGQGRDPPFCVKCHGQAEWSGCVLRLGGHDFMDYNPEVHSCDMNSEQVSFIWVPFINIYIYIW